jgi:ArsR family transcriptional regulator
LLNKAGLVPNQPLHRFKAEFFRALGHPARLRILELLRERERNVSELQTALEIEASSVSQQLAVLRAKNIVDTRRVGTSVYYSVRDPQVFQLLDVARQIFNNHLIDLQAMLEPPIPAEVAGARDGHRRTRQSKRLTASR